MKTSRAPGAARAKPNVKKTLRVLPRPGASQRTNEGPRFVHTVRPSEVRVELWPIDRVKPYPNNPRINDSAVAAVAASISQFGFRQPIVVDRDGVIIVGHARYKAARQLVLSEVPVHVADLTPEQARAYRLADNQTAALATWDFDLLPIELAAVQQDEFDLGQLGFDPADLARLMEPAIADGLCDPDFAPELPAEAVTRPGDLYSLGNHVLLCGDSARADAVDRLLRGAPVHLVHADPPYNVAVEPRSERAVGKSDDRLRAKDRPLANDSVTDLEYGRLLRAWFGNAARVLAPGRSFYFWGGYATCGSYAWALNACGLHFAQSIIWVKGRPVMGRKDFMGDHEWCFYGWKGGAAHEWFGPDNATDVWHVKREHHTELVHLTQKPVELATRAMQYSSRVGENVLDLFGGSGSTLIAAEQLGRNAFLMEIDPLYCDVIVQRWQKFTGRRAVHVAPGGEIPKPPMSETRGGSARASAAAK